MDRPLPAAEPVPGRSAMTNAEITGPLWKHPTLLLAAGLFLLRAMYAPWCELFPEEAYYWNYAQHLDIGYLDHPPMVAWLIALGGAVFGHNEWAVRVGALACSLATSFFAFRLAEIISRERRAATMAVLLVQVLPYFYVSGWMMTPDAPLTACWAATLYFLAQVFFENDGRAWFGVGVFLGLGMLSKYTIVLLGPATLLFLALDPGSRAWFRRVNPYAGVGLAMAIFSPVILWNAWHHWASFAFQSVGRVEAARRFSLHLLLLAVLVVLTPPVAWLAGRLLAARRTADEAGRRVLFARVYTLVPLTVFVVFSLTHRVKLNWTGPLWLAVVPAVGASLAAVLPGRVRTGWKVAGAVLWAGYVAALQYLASGLPGVRYFAQTELLPVGWKQMAAELETRRRDLERSRVPGPVFIVGMDRDFIASEEAFYCPDQAHAVGRTTGSHLFDSESLMYAYWFPARSLDGATLLLVAFDKAEIDGVRILRHCAGPGPVEGHALQLNGRPVRTYYTRVVTDYRSERRPVDPR